MPMVSQQHDSADADERPFSDVHLAAERTPGGDVHVTPIRVVIH
jgi:hypothetical protein